MVFDSIHFKVFFFFNRYEKSFKMKLNLVSLKMINNNSLIGKYEWSGVLICKNYWKGFNKQTTYDSVSKEIIFVYV